jgi:hypothetical protein
MRFLAVCAVFLVVVAAAGAATEKRTNACLKAHHVLTAPRAPRGVTRFGVHVEQFESFAFHGVPKKTYDSGSLIFERNAAAAARAKQTLYSRYAAFEIKHSSESPYRIRLDLRDTEEVIGNVVVVWNNYPQHAVAKSILRTCLR